MSGIPTIFLGCPGSGKTQTLVNTCKDLVKKNTDSLRDIGFFTFSRSAANEAKIRIRTEFPNMPQSCFPWFRTLHSFGRIVSGISIETIMQPWHYEQFFRKYGLTYDEENILDFSFPEWDLTNMASAFIYHDSIRRNSLLNTKDYLSGLLSIDPTAEKLSYFTKVYKEYKATNGIVDFTDLIENAIETKDHPKFKTLILDEAQDLTLLQWQLIDRLISNSENVFVAGDDRQNIYAFAGADVNRFISFSGNEVILNQSYRCPKKVQEQAAVLESRISLTRSVSFKPTDVEGEAQTVFNLKDIPIRINETWMFLARSKYHLKIIRDSVIRRINNIKDTKKKEIARDHILFLTIHKSKGKEADNVVVFLGITQRIMNSHSFLKNSFDNELRVFYVGFTRAKKRLYLYDTPKGLRFPF